MIQIYDLASTHDPNIEDEETWSEPEIDDTPTSNLDTLLTSPDFFEDYERSDIYSTRAR